MVIVVVMMMNEMNEPRRDFIEVDLKIIDEQMLELLKNKNYFNEKAPTFRSGLFNTVDEVAMLLSQLNEIYIELASNLGKVYNYLRRYTTDFYAIENKFLGVPVKRANMDDSNIFDIQDYMTIPGMSFENALYKLVLESTGTTPIVLTDDTINEFMRALSIENNDLIIRSKLPNLSTENNEFKIIDILPYYYAQAKSYYGALTSPPELIKYAKMLMDVDAQNGYEILYATPKLVSGDSNFNTLLHTDNGYYYSTKEYITYYSPNGMSSFYAPLQVFGANENGEIVSNPMSLNLRNTFIQNSNKVYKDLIYTYENVFTPNFVHQINECVEQFSYLYIDQNHEDFAPPGGAWGQPIDGKHSSVVFRGDIDITDPEYTRGAFLHELGHVYAEGTNNTYEGDIDETDEWKSIWEQVHTVFNKDESIIGGLGNPTEFFAEATAEYFGNSLVQDKYNPNHLKMIDIDVDGKNMTLYDYMDNLFN